MRKRTQAKQRSERESGGAPRPSIEDGRQVVDVIRKNSAARHHAHGSGPPAGAGVGTTPVLPPVTEQQPPPHAMNMSPQVPQAPVQAPPQPQRQFPNQHRYTLVDPGANSAGVSPPPSRTDSPGYARPAGRAPGQRTGSMPSPALPPDMEGPGGQGQGASQPPPQRPAAKGPTTFAEMGIQGVKLEEKECVIM